jgi:hypothetical protein
MEVTKEMNRKQRAHYMAQGATEVDLIESECAALVPGQDRRQETFLSTLLGGMLPQAKAAVRWRRWKLGNGFIATCNTCHTRGEYEEVTPGGAKKIRFHHCGNKVEKLPLLLRLLY